MLIRKRYTVKEIISWTRWEVFYLSLYSIVIVFLFDFCKLEFLLVPWLPVALIGTAVAFIVGFQNNAAYGRIWEARKIWGGIVNVSRAWAMKTRDYIASGPEHQQQWEMLVHRHIAWLISLRHEMRKRKKWEVFHEHKTNREWSDSIFTPEKELPLEEEIHKYIDTKKKECSYISSKNNESTAIIFLQSKQLKSLKEQNLLWEFSFLELENLLQEMLELQGKSERIKNFPYPRQYATLSYYFVWIFILLLPFGIVPEFAAMSTKMINNFPFISKHFTWLAVPFCTIVSWVFYTMERIGRVGENPFEGSANDVPISTISRSIEIDLLQLLGTDEEKIPPQFPEQNDVQM